MPGIESLPVVDDAQDDAALAALEREQHLARLGVTGDVRQALLGDPVEDELRLRVERRQVSLELPPDAHVRALLEATGKFRERAGKPEVIEEFGAQLLGEAAHVVEARLHDLLRLGQLRALLRVRVGGQSLELEQDGGHRLSDLVVQAAGEPLALLFLRLEGVRAGVAAFLLQPVEHPVEGLFKRADLANAVDRQALSAAKDVGGLHALGEPLERPEQMPQQKAVDDHHDKEGAEQDDQVEQCPVLVQRSREDDEHQRSDDQDRGVRREHTPEQRHPAGP